MSLKLAYLALVSSSYGFDFNPFNKIDEITSSISDKIDDAGQWVDDRGNDA